MTGLSYKACGLEAIDRNGPHLLFAEHHRCLRRAGARLLRRADGGNSLVAEYRAFEAQVLEHIEAEEVLILPAFTAAAPDEAAAIRAGHTEIRAQLVRTASDIEAPSRLASVRTLLALLDDHSKREDRVMYPWALMHLPAPRDGVATRVLTALTRFVRR